MTKLLLVAVLVGVGGYYAYAKVLRPAPKRACARMAELCDGAAQDPEDDSHDCTDFFDTLHKSDAAAADKTAQCVLEANSCPEAIGCAAGGAIKLGTGAARGFVDGLHKALH